VTRGVQPSQIFIPMHYARTNQLTFPAFDPDSRQPAYKACAVAIRAIGEGERVSDL
jgi:assimilatory nitrate reductase catalytic subunit